MSSESSFVQKRTANTVVTQDLSGIMAHGKIPFHFTATSNFTEV